jgi:hypothetical protein
MINETARAAGASVGMTTPQFADAVIAHKQSR